LDGEEGAFFDGCDIIIGAVDEFMLGEQGPAQLNVLAQEAFQSRHGEGFNVDVGCFGIGLQAEQDLFSDIGGGFVEAHLYKQV